MFYDRKIKYLDYKENGERIRGGGFLKMEVRNSCLQIDLSVTGLYPTDAFERDIVLYGEKGESSIGKIVINAGKGQFRQVCHDMENIGDGKISYAELQGLRIPLSTGRELSCRWERQTAGSGGRKEMAAAEKASAEKSQGEKAASKDADASEKRRDFYERDRYSVDGGYDTRTMTGSDGNNTAGFEKESRDISGNRKEETADKRIGRGEAEKPVRLLEDKWQQLYAIYPHIHPFHDEREYISIRPADFVLFPEESYKMANNSFLLHGYYNYRHLLLARVERKGEVFYYIGVPGNFYEKEKQVAIMFGFESFECAEEPAQAGDFGYYMMRTQL